MCRIFKHRSGRTQSNIFGGCVEITKQYSISGRKRNEFFLFSGVTKRTNFSNTTYVGTKKRKSHIIELPKEQESLRKWTSRHNADFLMSARLSAWNEYAIGTLASIKKVTKYNGMNTAINHDDEHVDESFTITISHSPTNPACTITNAKRKERGMSWNKRQSL